MEEPLANLIKPERIRQIKLDTIKKQRKSMVSTSPFLLDDEVGAGCASCFI